MSISNGVCELVFVKNKIGATIGFEAIDALTNCVIYCYGLREVYVFHFYENGKHISRRKLGLPKLYPCENGKIKGCVKFVYNPYTKRYYGLVYNGRYFYFSNIVLPRGVKVYTVLHRVPHLRGKPRCRLMSPCNEPLKTLWRDVSMTFKYTKKKGKELYIEGHCIRSVNVENYETLEDLINALYERCYECVDCLNDFIERNSFEDAVASGELEAEAQFYSERPPFRSFVAFKHSEFTQSEKRGLGLMRKERC